LKKKVFSLKNTSCYFLTTLTLSLPDWNNFSILYKEKWYIDINKFKNISEEWYPLSAVFIAEWRGKTWSEMNLEEQKKWWEKFIKKIKILLKKYYE
jgi:hypothetical protein